MRTLLLYDSTVASTKQLARVMAEVLGERSSLQMIPLVQARDFEVANADWLLIGGAMQRRTLSPLLRGWITSLPRGAVDGMPTALFDTRDRRAPALPESAAQVLAQELQQLGAILLAPPMSFWVATREGPLRTGEVTRAVSWAREVFDKACQWARSFQQPMGEETPWI